MGSFLVQMGGTSIHKDQLSHVIIEYVPVSFDLNGMGGLSIVEAVSGLGCTTIKEVRFIKPVHLHTPGQRMGHAILRLLTWEAANHAIEHGLFIEGKKVLT
jgi:hypothetical protein